MSSTAGSTQLEDLTPGVRASGVVVGHHVTVVDAKWHGSNALTLTYRDDAGRVDQRLLYRDHEPSLGVEQQARAYAFDGDPALFRLAAEALRIRMAARFDPMLAVTTSDLDPLPHQIKAVYGVQWCPDCDRPVTVDHLLDQHEDQAITRPTIR